MTAPAKHPVSGVSSAPQPGPFPAAPAAGGFSSNPQETCL